MLYDEPKAFSAGTQIAGLGLGFVQALTLESVVLSRRSAKAREVEYV